MKESSLLLDREPERMLALAWSIWRNGVLEPVLLGDDGRVWDGHHRLIAARAVRRAVPVLYGHSGR